MIRAVVLLLLVAVFRADCTDPAGIVEQVSALDEFHQQNVRGVFVLPKGELTQGEIEEVCASLDSESHYDGEKGYFRRNLVGILKLLKKANRHLEKLERVENMSLLRAYISVTCGVPVFAECSPVLQRVILCLQNDCYVRPLFDQNCDITGRFFKDYKDAEVTLSQALENFLSTVCHHKGEAVRFAISTQISLCSEHMLDHFVSLGDARTNFVGFFVTDVPRSKEEDKAIGVSIVEKFMGTPLNMMFVRPDIRDDGMVAVVLYRSFSYGEVKCLGKIISGTPFIAFSTSSRRDVFFPTNWVKLVLGFRSSKTGICEFFISSAHPDAVGFSQAEALAL